MYGREGLWGLKVDIGGGAEEAAPADWRPMARLVTRMPGGGNGEAYPAAGAGGRGDAARGIAFLLQASLPQQGSWGSAASGRMRMGQGELAECLLPVGNDLPFDEAPLGDSFGSAAQAFLFRAVAGSFVFYVADREPE